jgi:PAS domain S-box-containing protein
MGPNSNRLQLHTDLCAYLESVPDPVVVFDSGNRVAYLNPAFERLFGWTRADLEDDLQPFVPADQVAVSETAWAELSCGHPVHGFRTQRQTKAGRRIDVVLDTAQIADRDQQAWRIVTLRDESRAEQYRSMLLRMSRTLHQFEALDALLDFITRSVHEWMAVGGALVILRDELSDEFYFPVATFDDEKTGRRFKTIRFPTGRGVAGHVCRTGETLIVADYHNSPYALPEVDARSGYRTRNMLGVPLRMRTRVMGVLCAVNKKAGAFDNQDAALLGTIAGIAVLPIENARMRGALEASLQRVQDFNQAKDRVIHHLSHELKTPLAVLGAALTLLKNKLPGGPPGPQWTDIYRRAQRNLERLSAMESEIEDILRERDYSPHATMSHLLDACADLLETMVAGQAGDPDLLTALRRRIDSLFGPTGEGCASIGLEEFVSREIEGLRPRFAHRRLTLEVHAVPVQRIQIPASVLGKVVRGLVRNAVENTPDGGHIDIHICRGNKGPRFVVQDTGVGLEEHQRRLIVDNYFTDYEPLGYASKVPYDFGAGGRGFDLLRMVIFSERHGFDFHIDSRRCIYLSDSRSACPGDIGDCGYCRSATDCAQSGGTTVTVEFPPEKAVCDP